MHSDGYGVECVGTDEMKGQRCAGTDMEKKTEVYNYARKDQVNKNILHKKTETDMQKIAVKNILQNKTKEETPTDSLSQVKFLEDSSLLSFKFGRKKTSDQQEEIPRVSKADKNPRKIIGRVDKMLVKPVKTKDAARTARSDRLSQERSPGLGGR